MAIKRRVTTITTGVDGATGTASKTIGLGAGYAKVLKVEFKGDDANVDTNNTLALTDADGRIVLAATALDGGTDDSTAKATSQVYSTVGRGIYLGPVETDIADTGGDFSANTEGQAIGVIARSPVTVALAAGTDGDVHQVALIVEV